MLYKIKRTANQSQVGEGVGEGGVDGEGKNVLLRSLRVSEANEVPISSHIWVGLSTFNWL